MPLTHSNYENQHFVILLADDDEDDIYLFQEALIANKISIENIKLAGNGLDALESVNKFPIADIVFLDVNMPGKSGFDVLTDLRAKYTKEELPVIMYSTANDGHSTEKSKELGANLYLVKAFSHKGTVANISKVLGDKLIKGNFKVING